MTQLRRWSATSDESDRLAVEVSRLRCDCGPPASCREGGGKAQVSRGVDGWRATGLDTGSRVRQGDRKAVCMEFEQLWSLRPKRRKARARHASAGSGRFSQNGSETRESVGESWAGTSRALEQGRRCIVCGVRRLEN